MTFSGFFRFLGVGGIAVPPPVPYDPVYGLPKSVIDAWLAHNPELRRQHDIALRQRGGVK
jgi:hypothetical protein